MLISIHDYWKNHSFDYMDLCQQSTVFFEICYLDFSLDSPMAQTVKGLPTVRENWVQSLGTEDTLEKEIATHTRVLAWKIPWMKDPDRLQSMGWKTVRHD